MSAMAEKLQEKFALVQQMKKEKELKEAKAKDTQPFDIFALAGVNILTASGVNYGVGGQSDAQHASGRKLRLEKLSSATHLPAGGPHRRPSHSSTVTSPGGGSEVNVGAPGTEKKLKRSSMAVRNSAQTQGPDDGRKGSHGFDSATGSGRGRQNSVGSVTSSISTPGHNLVDSPTTATPPTPVPSPGNEESLPLSFQRARDMTRNIHSRAGSVDENEEMVLDVYGRSVPRSRHQSSDEGSDYGKDSTRSRRRYRSEYEVDYRRFQPGRYDSRVLSRSHSRSRSPKRRNSGRSRTRSPDMGNEYYRRRDYDQSRRSDRAAYPPDGSRTPVSEADPYLAASRYLDTVFYPTKIYVGNLPETATLTSLRTAFGPFGDIEDMNLVEGKDFGFITFKEPEAAKEALEKMNGMKLEGTLIRVNRAKIPERNRHGFAGVAWMDEDGELARMEEEQHQQAAAIAKTFLTPVSGSGSGSGSGSVHDNLSASFGSGALTSSEGLSRAIHQLPPRPRSPKLPPKPSSAFPPTGLDPRAAIAARGGGRQILKYDDL